MIPYNINDETPEPKTEYFGFMVDELTGEVEDLHVECDYKPKHEQGSYFSYAKWFESEEERDKTRIFTIEIIKEIQMNRRKTELQTKKKIEPQDTLKKFMSKGVN